MPQAYSRRTVLTGAAMTAGAAFAAGATMTAGGAGASGTVRGAQPATADDAARGAQPVAANATGVAGNFDLATPAGNVRAYLKLRASIETQDVYFWFAGRLDVAVAGEPIRPIVNVETLILRRTERLGDLAWNVIDWEASFYRDIDTGELIEGEITNPANGEKVTPLPYTEGPVRFRFTDREPRIMGSRDVMPNTGKPFHYDYRIVDGTLSMTKSSYITVPQFLDMAAYPRESSGAKLFVSSHSTLAAPLAEVQDPDIASAASTFSYTAASSWLPWMKLGQTPGHVIWAEAGRKLFSLDDAPPAQLEILRKLNPQWFGRPEPWPDFTNMYLQYKARHPVKG